MDQGETLVLNAGGIQENPNKSPWGKTPEVAPCSLSSVIDEELARDLQSEEDLVLQQSISVELPPELGGSNSDVENDFLLAQMLQSEFDKENDRYINFYEQNYNRGKKVLLNFDNYRSLYPVVKEDYPPSYALDPLPPDVDPNNLSVKQKASQKKISTKHDPAICGQKNVKILENFPPGFAAGDVGNHQLQLGLKLSNSAYNSLKKHSKKEERQSYRLHEKKEHSTHEQALDPKTRLLLYKMVNNETLENVNGCISTGKESCVFHAKGGRKGNGEQLPPECAIKIFKTTLNEFRTRERYIKDDPRFKDRFSKQNPRKVIHLWAEKEMCNLSRMQKAGILCPSVVLLKKHILIMSFVGSNMKAAPKLKDAVLSSNQLKLAYEQCIEMMCTMYQKCKLIHADLSEYNMLWHENHVWFIDVSQSVEPAHTDALEFLYRDCTNVVEFFKKRGQKNVMSVPQLFVKVSGLDIPLDDDESQFLSKVKSYEKYEMTIGRNNDGESYAFDYFFNKTKPIESDDEQDSDDCKDE